MTNENNWLFFNSFLTAEQIRTIVLSEMMDWYRQEWGEKGQKQKHMKKSKIRVLDYWKLKKNQIIAVWEADGGLLV